VVGVVLGVTAARIRTGQGPRYSALVEERYESELAQSAQVLDNVDRALERLSAGSYATCEDCGGEIDDAHLAADPTRRICSDCSHVASF
jgi:DnaK suppressor protein